MEKDRQEAPLPLPMPRIERKSLLYKSGLGFFCINHVQGCKHGCRFPCHAFKIFERHGRVRDYADWCHPRIVGNALELLERELEKKRTLPECVHLCLSTDPFMVGFPEVAAMSLALIERLNRSRISVSVLTKGILPECLVDTRQFPAENVYGISLVSLDEDFRRRWEPGAAAYSQRIAALRRLHEAGRQTYVHMEPYPTPNIIEQDLQTILRAVAFVDSIFFGGWNYNSIVRRFAAPEGFYTQQVELLRRFCSEHGTKLTTASE